MRSMNLLHCARLVGLMAPLLLLPACEGPSEADLVAAAQQAMLKREPKAAIISLKTALQMNSSSAQTRFLLGKALLETGDLGPATVELSKSRELGQPDTDVLPLLVRAMTQAGQAEQATTRFNKITFDDKAATAELKVAVAIAWGAQGKRAEMQEAIKQALAAMPTQTTAQVMNARYAAERGEFAEAIKTADDVIAREPSKADAWQLKGLLLRHARADDPAAMAAFRKAAEVEPTMLSAHSQILSMLFAAQDKKGMREQIEALQKALPDSAGTYLFRAQVEFLDGNLKLARELVQQVLRVDDPSARALMLAARIEFQAGSLALVESHLNRVLQKDPKHEGARRLLAATYIRSGQTPKALAALQPLLDASTPSADVLGLAAEAFLNSGDTSKAESYFQRAAKIKPNDPHLRTAIALNQIAKGQAQGGFAELELVASSDTSTFADLALISAHLRRNEHDAALKAIDRLEIKLPGKPLPADLRGRVQMERKDLPRARASFERAMSLDPSYFPGAVSLAALDINDKKIDQAKTRFDALLKLDPTTSAPSWPWPISRPATKSPGSRSPRCTSRPSRATCSSCNRAWP